MSKTHPSISENYIEKFLSSDSIKVLLIVPVISFMPKGSSSELHATWGRHKSLVSFSIEQFVWFFFNLSLTFMTLTPLKLTDQLFYRMLFSLDFLGFS